MSELLKKYESIDESKLSEGAKKILNRVKTITADFTTDDAKNNKIADDVLNEIMKKFPDSVKIVKRTPKAKTTPKKTHKATHTNKAKKTATTSTAKSSSNNIMSVAKEIQKSGESWKDAMERAKVVLKERREEVVQKKRTELEKLYALVKTKKELQGFANSDIERDSVRESKVKGVRVVSKQGFTSNQYAKNVPNKLGRRYWETRENRSDRLAPNYQKDMPLLAKGGSVDKYDIDRFKQVMNDKAIARYVVRLQDGFGNKETYVFGIKLKDKFKGCELEPYEVLYGSWTDSGMPFSLSNLQVKKLVPDTFTNVELDEAEAKDLISKIIKNDKAGVEKFLNSGFFFLSSKKFEDLLKEHFQKSVVNFISFEFRIAENFADGGSFAPNVSDGTDFMDNAYFANGGGIDGGMNNLTIQEVSFANGGSVNMNKHIWEGWTVGDFIEDLEPQFNQIMSGGSWQKPFKTKDEVKAWCMDNQPYYKKNIPEVVNYFWAKVQSKGNYADGGSLYSKATKSQYLEKYSKNGNLVRTAEQFDSGNWVVSVYSGVDVSGEYSNEEFNKKIKKYFNKYADGGSVSNERMFNFLNDDLGKLEEAIKDGDFEEVNRFFSYWLGSSGHLKSLETKTNERMYNFLKEDLEKLMVAVENNDTEEVERFFSYWGQHLESLKMANGGSLPFMTDPNFGNFQNTGAFANGGSIGDLTEQEFLKKYFGANVFTENPSQYFEIKKMSSSNDEKINAFVKELKADGFTVKKRAYSDFTSVMGVKKKGSYELGGAFVMTDLAGHTGGSDGLGNPMPLSGVSGTHYTGLVGETGAMSSGELFMDGGAMAQNQQVIDGASQNYVITEAFGNPAQQLGMLAKGGSIQNQYKGRTAKDIWSNLTIEQRRHFLFDHQEELPERFTGYYVVNELAKRDFESSPKEVQFIFEIHVKTGQYASGGSLGKALYVEYSSYFDYNKYDTDKIISALEGIGAKNIRLEKDNGMFNQPEVVVFNGDKNKAVDALNEAFDTDYIRISEKDWRTKKMADGGFTPDVSDGTQFMSGVYAKGGEIEEEQEYLVVLQHSETGDLMNFNVLGNNEENAIDNAYMEADLNQPYEVYSVKKYADGGFTPDVSDGTQFMSGVYANGGSVGDDFQEVIDLGSEQYYTRPFGIVESESNGEVELVAVATIKDLEDYMSEDELPEEGNFQLDITLVPTEEFISEEILESANDEDSSSISDDSVVNVVNYAGGLNYSPQERVFFESHQDALDYLMSEELKEQINRDTFSSDYIMYKQYNRIGQTNSEFLDYLMGVTDRFAKGGFVGTVEFNVGDTVWQKDEKRYATVMNNYGDPINGDYGDIRLDTTGNTSIYSHDPKRKTPATIANATGYNLIKVGEKGDTGKFTPEVLAEMKESANRLIDSRKKAKDEEGVAYYQKVYRRLRDGEFDSMTGAKATASNKKGSSDYTYVPNKDVKELSVVVKGELKELMGSDILDGVYVKNSAKSAKKVDANAVFAKILKDAKEAKVGKSKKFTATDLKKVKLEDIKKLVDAGYTEQQVRNIIFGYAFDNEIVADNEFEYDNGIFSYEPTYVDSKINSLVEAKEKNEFVLGIEYPDFDWKDIIKKYKISAKPKNISKKNKTMETFYQAFVGENVVIGHSYGYNWFNDDGSVLRSYVEDGKKITDANKQTAYQKEREYNSGFNGGYWYIVSSKIEIIDDILKTLLSQKGSYCKEINFYSDSFSEILKQNKIAFADGGELNKNNVKVGDVLVSNTGVDVKVVEFDPKFGGRIRAVRLDEYATGKASQFMPLNKFTRKTNSKMADGGAIGSGKNGYVAFYKGKRIEVYADTIYQAQQIASKHFKARKDYDVNVVLAEVDGKPYVRDTLFADGGLLSSSQIEKLDRGFTIPQLNDMLEQMFPDSFGFEVYKQMPTSMGTRDKLYYDYDNKVKDDKLKLYFHHKDYGRDLNYEVRQGQENTYFNFLLIDDNIDTYVGAFGFKDEGDVDSSYITKFVSFLQDAFHYPLQVRHSVMANGGFMNGVYANGGGSTQGNNIDAELEDFDLDNLDPFETMQYNHFVKSSGKVGALQILINTVEGDYSQLSPELAELAEMQMSTEEYDEATRQMRFERDGYAKGGDVSGKLESGVYRVGKPTKVSANLYEQKIAEIFDNGDISTASDYGRKLGDFKSQKYPIITKEQLENQYKMADGGSTGSGLDPVKVKVVMAVGLDSAIEFYDADYPIRPYQLLERAVRAGYITLDEINERVVDSAMETAQDSEDMEEVGSSDFGAFMYNFLDEAGFKVGRVNGRLIREYADGGNVGGIKDNSGLGITNQHLIGRRTQFKIFADYKKEAEVISKIKILFPNDNITHDIYYDELRSENELEVSLIPNLQSTYSLYSINNELENLKKIGLIRSFNTSFRQFSSGGSFAPNVSDGTAFMDNAYFADGGEIRRFDRHEQMDSQTREEILDIVSEPELRGSLTNYLYGLYDGYDYSQTERFKDEMKNLKSKDLVLHDRINAIYKKIDKYKFEKYYDFADGGFMNDVYAKGGKLPKKNTPEYRQYQIAKDTIKNPIKGDLMGGMTLEEAKKIVSKYANGGMFDDNDGFMRADNNRNFRYPEMEVYVETFDEPIDLTSNISSNTNNVVIRPLDQAIDLNEDGRIRAKMSYNPVGRTPEKMMAVNQRMVVTDLPMPTSHTHKND